MGSAFSFRPLLNFVAAGDELVRFGFFCCELILVGSFLAFFQSFWNFLAQKREWPALKLWYFWNPEMMHESWGLQWCVSLANVMVAVIAIYWFNKAVLKL